MIKSKQQLPENVEQVLLGTVFFEELARKKELKLKRNI